MSDNRRFFVITNRGEVGPFTLEDLKEELAAQRLARTDRLRTAFGASLGTVEEAVGPAPRNQRRTSEVSPSPASGSELRPKTDPLRARTSASNRVVREPLRSNLAPARKPIVIPLVILGGVMAMGFGALAWNHSSRRAEPSTPTPPSFPNRAYQNVVQTIPGIIKVWRFDEGGEGVGYHDWDKENHGTNTVRPNTGVDLLQYHERGELKVGYVDDGEWLAFTCQVASAGRYRWSLSGSRNETALPNPNPGPIGLFWSVKHKSLGPPLIITNTNSWDNYQPFSGEVDLNAGVQVLQLNAKGSGMNYGDITFTQIPTPTP